MKCGMRVVRGPDWKWSNQDGGQGHLGTVIGVSRVNRTCMVQWDVGTVTECRAGGEGLADLRIFDNGQTGVQQDGYCDACQVEQKQLIRGFRWKCLNCKDFDLCNACYMMDKHDNTHPFIRLKSQQSVIVPVPPRRRSRKVKLYGISEGAKVKHVQSGGLKVKHANEIGEVIEFVDMMPLSYNGGVKVKWPSGETSNHRLGADGKVDLVMVESHQYSYPAYLDHLPVGDLTQPFETLLNIGDKVCVDLNLDTAQKIQVEYKDCNQPTEKVLGEIGTVVALDGNSCQIQYDSDRCWFYQGACRKVSIIEEGDRVKVIENESRVINLQARHGGWTDDMKSILGDVGVVVSIDPDVGDLEVNFKDSTYLLNMSCCVKYDGDTVSGLQTTRPMTGLEDLLGLSQQLLAQTQPLPPPDTEDSFMLQPGLPSSDEEEKSDNNSITSEFQDDNQGSGGSAAESDSEDDDDDDTVIFYLNGMTIGKGLRVVRGQDWKWEDQDGGKGHLGTVVELALQKQSDVPPQCVIIQWDEGNRNTYRVGYENCYDLRIYDNAGLGVKHEVRCDGDCGEAEIMGFLWKCATCKNVNLCSQCYHAEKHDIKHPFHRIDSPGEEPVSVPKRQICQRNRVYGIFEGAKVVRGPDWRWHDQDGSSEGEVIAIVNFSFDSDRDAAEVTWSNGHTNVYRLGYKGALDVKYTKPAIGGTYFPDHLPILKLPKEEEIPEAAATTPATTEPDTATSMVYEDDGRLKKGDRVHIGCDPDTLKAIQQSVGGWSNNMVDCIGEEGEVLLINNGNVTVKFKSGKWTLNVMCLEKVNPIQKGCVVRVDPDEWKVRRLQGSLWSVELRKVIGKKGLVHSVDDNGVVEVKFGPMTFHIKSDCLTIVAGEVPDDIPEFEEQQEDQEEEEATVTVPEPEKTTELIPASPELVHAVVNGVTGTIQKLVDENPDLVNSVDGKTPVLHLAIIRGNGNVVEKLLQLGADKEIKNEEGSTPLLTAVKFKKFECVRLLIDHGANVNAINNNQQTSLHLAVQNKDTEILKLFKSTKKCNINKKDKLGDSAVTDAINIGDDETMRIILEWPNVDLKFVNTLGFSPIHFAARKGDLQAVRLILQKCPDVLNSQKNDGYSALHLAACMDHHDIADHLIHFKGINVESRTTEEGLTPLHIACRYASAQTVESLINAVQTRSDEGKCTGLFSVDKNGNNALHHCLMGKPEFMEMSRMQKNDSNTTQEQTVDRCKIINQLIRFGVPYNKPNNDGVTASDVLCSGQLRDELQKCINEREQQLKSKPDARLKMVICRNCEEEGVKTPAKLKLKPCNCTLCEDCCGAKPRKCANCNQRVTSCDQLK